MFLVSQTRTLTRYEVLQWSNSCKMFSFIFAFITHWFLLDFLPVAMYTVSVLHRELMEVFNFSLTTWESPRQGHGGCLSGCLWGFVLPTSLLLLVCLSVWQLLQACLFSVSFCFRVSVRSVLFPLVWLLVDCWPHKPLPEAVTALGKRSPDGTLSLPLFDGCQRREGKPIIRSKPAEGGVDQGPVWPCRWLEESAIL